MPLRTILAAVLAALAVACSGGDATPNAPAGGGVATETPAPNPGQADPGGELTEPGAGEVAPTDKAGIETPED